MALTLIQSSHKKPKVATYESKLDLSISADIYLSCSTILEVIVTNYLLCFMYWSLANVLLCLQPMIPMKIRSPYTTERLLGVARGSPSPWLRHKANQGWRASESPPSTFDEPETTQLFWLPEAGLGLLPDCD
jgi:hypothetical protein